MLLLSELTQKGNELQQNQPRALPGKDSQRGGEDSPTFFLQRKLNSHLFPWWKKVSMFQPVGSVRNVLFFNWGHHKTTSPEDLILCHWNLLTLSLTGAWISCPVS